MKYTIPQGGEGESNRVKYQTYTSEGRKIRPTGRGGVVLSFELALSKRSRRDAEDRHRWGRRKGNSEGEGWRDKKAR